MIRRWLPALLLLGLASCQPSAKDEVIILHTGRMGGNVYPLDLRGLAPIQHYPYLAGYVNQVRAEAAKTGATVLLLDSGDSLGGSFASYATGSLNVTRLFNHLQYDAVFLGNLDADISPSVLAEIECPVLIPFVRPDGDDAIEGALFSAEIERNGRRIRLLPNFYGNFPLETAPRRFPMWFGPGAGPVEPLRNYAPMLQSGRADLTVFSWMKFEPAEDPPAPYLEQLQSWGVDAVIAHRIDYSPRESGPAPDRGDWPLPVSENILRRNSGFTIARMDLARRDGKWTATRPSEIIHLTANVAPADPAIVGEINRLSDIIQRADRPLGELRSAVEPDSILSAYLAALTTVPGADYVLYSSDSIRAGLDRGPLSAARLYNALPWTSPLYRVKLGAAQIETLAGRDDYVLWRRVGAGANDGRLITSRFFALVLKNELGLDDSLLEPVGPQAEFDFLVDAVQHQKVLLEFPSVPAGWSP